MSAPGDDATPDEHEVARLSTAHLIEADATGALLGIRVLAAAPGTAVVTMRVRDDMLNGWAVCHGGLIATLADTAFAVACNSRGRVSVAAGFDVSFLEPGHAGDELVATAREVALRGRSGVYDVTVRRAADDVVIAEFRGRSRALGTINPALERRTDS